MRTVHLLKPFRSFFANLRDNDQRCSICIATRQKSPGFFLLWKHFHYIRTTSRSAPCPTGSQKVKISAVVLVLTSRTASAFAVLPCQVLYLCQTDWSRCSHPNHYLMLSKCYSRYYKCKYSFAYFLWVSLLAVNTKQAVDLYARVWMNP